MQTRILPDINDLTVDEVNKKILKLLNFEAPPLNQTISETVIKVKEFLVDLEVTEATEIFVKIFGKLVV